VGDLGCCCLVCPTSSRLNIEYFMFPVAKALVTLSRLGVPSSHDLRVTDHCRTDFSLERTGPLPTF